MFEFKLPNGLKVLIKQVKSAPVFTAQLWFKVGSIDEPSGLFGAAHLIEHMLFRSTENFPDGQMSKLVHKYGGIDNAATSYDYTYYWVLLGKEYLDFSLQVMRDRFFPLFKEDELQKEIGVVLSELAGYENRPMTSIMETLSNIAYTKSPYKRPIIGYREDLENIDRNRLIEFYNSFYAPNNATLVLVGDIEVENTKELVVKYFSHIYSADLPKRKYAIEPPQKGLREACVSLEGDNNIVNLAYHIPNLHHKDMDALVLLSSIICDGKTSRLNQALVETGKVASVYANPFSRKLDSLFVIGSVGNGNNDEYTMVDLILDEIEKIKSHPITLEELDRAKNKNKADIIFETDSVSGLGNALGIADVYGDWRDYDDQIPRLESVTLEDISRVLNKYFILSNLNIVKTAPKVESVKIDLEKPKEYTPFINDNSEKSFESCDPKRFVLSNGMVVLIAQNKTFPTVAIEGYIKHGDMYENINCPGISKLMCNVLTRGTKTRDAQEIAQSMENVGAYLDYDTTCEKFTISAKGLSKDLDLLLYNISDTIINATFPEIEIEKTREETIPFMQYNKQMPNKVASQSFYNNLFKPGEPFYLEDFDKTIEYTKIFKKEHILEFYKGLKPEDCVISIVGDIDIDRTLSLCHKYFSDWENNISNKIIKENINPIPNEIKRINIPLSDKSESYVIYGYPFNFKRQHEDFYKFRLANQILGGTLNSRFGQEIRENRGLVYSINSNFNGIAINGLWKVSFGTKGKYVDEALNCINDLMEDFVNNGVTQEELDDARNFIIGMFVKGLETNEGLANCLCAIEYSNLGLDYIKNIKSKYENITTDDIKEVAKKYIYPGKGLVVVSGDY